MPVPPHSTVGVDIGFELVEEIRKLGHLIAKLEEPGQQRGAVIVAISMLLLEQEPETIAEVFHAVRIELAAFARWQAGSGDG